MQVGASYGKGHTCLEKKQVLHSATRQAYHKRQHLKSKLGCVHAADAQPTSSTLHIYMRVTFRVTF